MASFLAGAVSLIAAVLIYVGGWHSGVGSVEPRLASSPTLLPPDLIQYFTFGYNEPLADMIWLRAIQDFDFCGSNFSKIKVNDEGNEVNICHGGWGSAMLDAVTRVVPRYRIVYTRGAIYLSVAVNEKEGAEKLLLRGIEVYPDFWYIHYHLGYHYLLEMDLPGKAAEHFRQAALLGSPNWVQLLAARLYSDSGKAELGIVTLEEYYKDTPFEEWPVRAKQRYRELQAKRKTSP